MYVRTHTHHVSGLNPVGALRECSRHLFLLLFLYAEGDLSLSGVFPGIGSMLCRSPLLVCVVCVCVTERVPRCMLPVHAVVEDCIRPSAHPPLCRLPAHRPPSLFSPLLVSLPFHVCFESGGTPSPAPSRVRQGGRDRSRQEGEYVRDCGGRSSERARARARGGDGQTTNSQRSQPETRGERRAFFCLLSSSPPRQLTCGWPGHQPVVRNARGFCTL